MAVKSVLFATSLCAGLLFAGNASAKVVCQGPGWSVEGDVAWKPSTKQVKDIITQAKDRAIPGNFSCCNQVGADGRVCQDYSEDASGNVAEAGDEHERTPAPTPASPKTR